MNICLNCGKECGELLCSACNETADKEDLIMRICSYTPGNDCNYNEIWEKIAEKLSDKRNFQGLAFALASDLKSPRKEYMIFKYIHKASGGSIAKDSKKWFYDNVNILLDEGISDEEKRLVYAVYLYCLYTDHKYPEAEKTAQLIYKKGDFSYSEAYNLSDYFMKTRRYGIASELLEKAVRDCEKPYSISKLKRLLHETKQRQSGSENGGIAGYMPSDPANKAKYFEFMETLGIAVDRPRYTRSGSRRKSSGKIAKSDYPDLPCYRDSGFKSFTAYDIETTGLKPHYDNIIEIGAVRVRDGVIIDKFQTLVHPMDRRINEDAQRISGISNEDVKNAPDNKTAFNAFADFIGDDILLGFNNHRFDDKFLVRAGRYAQRIISNKSFDVMTYALKFADRLTLKDGSISLESCCSQLAVTNKKAHRALSDAEAAAQVYLKLLQMDNGSKVSLDDILSDDDWA